jgi:hypothetical protein
VIESAVEIKAWVAATPDPGQVRPARCAACGTAACPLGRPIQLVGHGLRDRQVLGPLEPGQAALSLIVMVRRYLCLACGAVMTVVPRGVLAWRTYSLLAMAVAMALWALRGWASARVRRAVSPWREVADPRQWGTLGRWVDAIAEGKVLSGWVRPCPPGWDRRRVAERIVMTLVAAGRVPSDLARAPVPAPVPDTG